jgi:hypothetical protein
MKIEAETKKNRLLFNEIKKFLTKHFPDTFEEFEQYDDCYHIAIHSQEKDSRAVWFEYDIGNAELIVGYGTSHQHYGKQYGLEIAEGLNNFLNSLVSKKRTIEFYKGSVNFKTRYELYQKNGTYGNSGTSFIFLYPFWKKTTQKITEENELIRSESAKLEIKKIRELIGSVS